MKLLSNILVKLNFAPMVYKLIGRYRTRGRTVQDIFTNIYHNNTRGGKQSVSGAGSDPQQTQYLVGQLSSLFQQYSIRSVLDAPCGDFHWMRHVDLTGIVYIGLDIVADIIDRNTTQYSKKGITFRKSNIISDPIERCDLILVRDCFVHFSFSDIISSLQNIYDSGSIYLLTTTFPSRKRNIDIKTGQWRPLNLEAAPFFFPKPITLISEQCNEWFGSYRDKSLGLRRIADINKLTNERYEKSL